MAKSAEHIFLVGSFVSYSKRKKQILKIKLKLFLTKAFLSFAHFWQSKIAHLHRHLVHVLGHQVEEEEVAHPLEVVQVGGLQDVLDLVTGDASPRAGLPTTITITITNNNNNTFCYCKEKTLRRFVKFLKYFPDFNNCKVHLTLGHSIKRVPLAKDHLTIVH